MAASVFRYTNSGSQQDSDAWILVWQRKVKVWKRGKITLQRYGKSHIHIKSEDVYADLAGEIEKRFTKSNQESDRPLSIDKDKKVIELTKDEFGWKIMKEFVALTRWIRRYFIDDGHAEKKAMGTKKRMINREIK